MQRVRRDRLGAQPRALLDAEAVLLVDDRQPEAIEVHALLEEGVRADRERGLPVRELLERRRARPRALAAEERLDAQPKRQQQRRQLAGVLPRKQLGGCHQRRLHAVLRREQHRRRSDQRLAAADVALQQAVHRHVAAHVGPDLEDDLALRAGQRERQRTLEPLQQVGRHAQRARVVIALAFGAAQLRRGREREELGKDEALARALRFLRRFRRVHRAVRVAQRRIAPRGR